jgi:hypothetical protein
MQVPVTILANGSSIAEAKLLKTELEARKLSRVRQKLGEMSHV